MYLQPNTLLQGGKYKIVRFISSGGFGNTYEGELVLIHRRVAIKEFFVKDCCNRDGDTSHVSVSTQSKVDLVERLKRKFMEEAASIWQFNHPNIVRVTDVFEENGTAYYAMDYVEGMSLQDMLKRNGAMSEAKALQYIRQVGEALKYVHAQNRLHLDIKPGNIMVDASDKAILIDFGASKQYDEAGENTSTLLGLNTVGYAPVEQMSRSFSDFNPAADVYALGATLYKLLTNITPPDAIMLMSGDEELAPLPSHISNATRTAVEKAMIPQRKRRTQTISEFLAMLNNQPATAPAETPKEDDEVTVVNVEPVHTPCKPVKALYPIRKWVMALFGITYFLTMVCSIFLSGNVPDGYREYIYKHFEYKGGIPVYTTQEWDYDLQKWVDVTIELNIEECERFYWMCTILGIFVLLVAIIMAYQSVRSTISISNRQAQLSSWWVSFLIAVGMLASGYLLLVAPLHAAASDYLAGILFSMGDTIIALLVLLYLRSKSNVEERWDYLMPKWFIPNAGRGIKLWNHILLIWPIVLLLPAPGGWFPCLWLLAVWGFLFLPIAFIRYVVRIAKGKE